MRSLPITLVLLAMASCSDGVSSSPTATAADAGGVEASTGGSPSDAGSPTNDADADAGEPVVPQEENEPNNGTTTTELNTMTLPGTMKGSIDPANDVDLFSIAPAPGELWEWTLTPSGSDLAAHLTVFDGDPNNAVNPTVLAKSTAGKAATLEHFVLGPGKLLAAVRDARNVPTPSDHGGPTYGYSLSAKKKGPAPIPITLPSVKQGKLASLSSVDLYSFTLTKSTDLDVIVRAEQKAPASTLDSRVSIFSLTTKKSLGTNDNVPGSTDSKLGGTLPAGSYLIVLDNEGTNDADLSYEIELALR